LIAVNVSRASVPSKDDQTKEAVIRLPHPKSSKPALTTRGLGPGT